VVSGVLFLLPALALAALLLFGRYPGETVIRRLARRRPGCRHRAPRAVAAPSAEKVVVATRLSPIARSLAGRAPPRPGLLQRVLSTA
jgi:hypothetical protein